MFGSTKECVLYSGEEKKQGSRNNKIFIEFIVITKSLIFFVDILSIKF